MAVYRVTGPDGKTYKVNAPEGSTEQDAIAYVQKQFYKAPARQPDALDNPDPTEGMSGTDKFLAGAGGAMTDLARGIGQMFGAVSREDVAEARARDKPLQATGAGTAGNIVGNVAMIAPSLLIPGAATIPGAAAVGAVTGALQPSTSTKETVTNTGLGGVLAPLGPLVARGARAASGLVRGLIDPLTGAGQDRIAADVVRRSATDPVAAARAAAGARELVPGSAPTMAQAAQDPGLAQLERTLLNNPEFAGPLQQRMAAQRAARRAAVDDVAGQNVTWNQGVPSTYADDIAAGRDLFAREDYSRALAQGIDPDMAVAMAPQIENLMARPAMQDAAATARRIAANRSEAMSPAGSAQGLLSLKKALDKNITRARKDVTASGADDVEALTGVKSDLLSTMRQVSPALGEANDNFAQMSRQVNSMEVGQSLRDKLFGAGSEYMQAGGNTDEAAKTFAKALSNVRTNGTQKITGQAADLENVMLPGDVAALENVARDLGRQVFADTAGRAKGSPTAQNMISQNLLRRALGPTGLPESWIESQALQTMLAPVQGVANMTGAQRRVMERLAEGMLDPATASMWLTAPTHAPRMGLLGSGQFDHLLAAPGLLSITGGVGQ